jgi:hypothetical protein
MGTASDPPTSTKALALQGFTHASYSFCEKSFLPCGMLRFMFFGTFSRLTFRTLVSACCCCWLSASGAAAIDSISSDETIKTQAMILAAANEKKGKNLISNIFFFVILF